MLKFEDVWRLKKIIILQRTKSKEKLCLLKIYAGFCRELWLAIVHRSNEETIVTGQ